jgi:protease IV
MRRFVVGALAVIGGVVLAFFAVAVLAVVLLRPATPALPYKIVLRVDLTRGLAEAPPSNPLLALVSGPRATMRQFLEALATAAADPRVAGLVARVGSDNLGLAATQQVRDAITAFRTKGKFAIAFADSFGELGPGTGPYYLATAFDRIWLQPMGSVGLTGLYADSPFFRGTLDLLGIVPEFDHREQYKTAADILTKTGFTAAQREETESLLASLGDQIVGGIAKDRKLSPEAVRADIDRGPLVDSEALRAGLVDRLGYEDEALAATEMRAGAGAEVVPLSTYFRAAVAPPAGPRIAVVYGSGLIVRGRRATNPFAGADEMAADDIVRAFRDAAADPRVRAILFRIDSPGGSVVASETIWRAVVAAERHGKPVVVSMGDVAGSGGYYVAAPADKIVAEPATLTGSIGVLAGKVVVADFLKKLGITTDAAQLGTNAAMFSPTEPFSAAGHARLEAFLDASYQGFKKHVMTGRHMSAAAVEAVAKGRVWTGAQAQGLGLVDALGGWETALRLARQLAKIPQGTPVELAVYPRPQGPLRFLFDRLTGGRRDGTDGTGAIGNVVAALAPLLARLDALADGPVAALMPPLGPVR